MADEEDRTVIRLQVAQNGKEAIHLLRTQHRCRFVKDEDARIPGECFEDFNALF